MTLLLQAVAQIVVRVTPRLQVRLWLLRRICDGCLHTMAVQWRDLLLVLVLRSIPIVIVLRITTHVLLHLLRRGAIYGSTRKVPLYLHVGTCKSTWRTP